MFWERFIPVTFILGIEKVLCVRWSMMQRNNVLFSIVVTIYNKADVIERCVTSLINQTYSNIQIVLVNDGSKDDSLKLCYDYAKKDSRVIVVDQQNQGVAGARNTGLSAADGQYVTFVDADDYLEPNVFENVAALLANKQCLDMITWGCIEEDSSGKILESISMEQGAYSTKKQAYLEINRRLLGYIWLWAFKKDMLCKNQLLFEKFFEPIDDYLFVLKAFEKANSVGSVENTFYHYVRSDSLQSLSKTIPPHIFQQHLQITMFKLKLFQQLHMDEVYIAREMKIAMYAAFKNGIKRMFRHEEADIMTKIQQLIDVPEMQKYFYGNNVEIKVKESEIPRYNAALSKDCAQLYELFLEYENKKRKQSGEFRYSFPTNITDKSLAREVLMGKKSVAIYGMYPFGEGYVEDLIRRKVNVEALFDASQGLSTSDRTVCGIKVKPEEDLRNYNGVLIIAGNGSFQRLSKKAREYGIKHMLPYYFIYDGCSFGYIEYRDKYQIVNVAKTHLMQIEYPEKVFINSLELAITHRCALNCDKCANLISYFEFPRDAHFDKMSSSVKKILDANVYINELRILGGEPFLNKDLVHYLRLLQPYANIGLISIMTNATVLPTEEEIKCLKDPRVYVTMSNYGPKSTKLDALKKRFEQEGILYRIYNVSEWQDCNTIEYESLSSEELKARMNNCSANNCYTLYDSKLYRCPYNAGVTILHAIPEEIADYLDIEKIDAADICCTLTEFMRKDFSKICAYCRSRPRSGKTIEVAKQLKGKHPYKKYEYKE